MQGFGVMIQSLGGNERTLNAIKLSLGKVIKKVSIDENELVFNFTDDTKLRVYDDGQSCCEDRYMRTDDDLSDFVGSTLMDFELKDAPNIEDKYGEHEVQFLDVKTSDGIFTISNHNEHNGYYGGFWVVAIYEQ